MSTIDVIRRGYKDKVDEYPKEKPSIINLSNFAMFRIRISSYKLEQKMVDINTILKEGKIKDTNVIEECKKNLKNMKIIMDDIFKKMKEDKDISERVLFNMELKYEYYLARPEALDTYKRIANSIIKENVEKLVKYEKIFLIYNEKFIEMIKKLNNNN